MSHPVLTFSAQSFGEVYSITRIPNGDLHVDFRKSEVAETVCLICFGPSETLKAFSGLPTTCKGLYRRCWERGSVVVYGKETMTTRSSCSSCIRDPAPGHVVSWRRYDEDIHSLPIHQSVVPFYPRAMPRFHFLLLLLCPPSSVYMPPFFSTSLCTYLHRLPNS